MGMGARGLLEWSMRVKVGGESGRGFCDVEGNKTFSHFRVTLV